MRVRWAHHDSEGLGPAGRVVETHYTLSCLECLKQKTRVIAPVTCRHRYFLKVSMTSFTDEPVVTLDDHNDSVTTINFSPNGIYLASGNEGGLVLVHSVLNWTPLLRFVGTSPITSSTWHPRLQRVFFCGCKSGDVHMVQFSTSGVRSSISITVHRRPDIYVNRGHRFHVDGPHEGSDPLPWASWLGKYPRRRLWKGCFSGHISTTDGQPHELDKYQIPSVSLSAPRI